MKRPCPWEVEHQPMLKMHHSEKDETVKTGAMETVYSKTLAMLFNGANKKNNNQSGIIPTCVSCLRKQSCQSSAMMTTCASCSGSVCVDCRQTCITCQQDVCGNCSILNPLRGVMCLGCRD